MSTTEYNYNPEHMIFSQATMPHPAGRLLEQNSDTSMHLQSQMK